MSQLDKFLDKNKQETYLENLGYEYLETLWHVFIHIWHKGTHSKRINWRLSLLPGYGVIVLYATCASINWQQDSARWSANHVESTVSNKEDCVPM